jgi:hypothetical protein
MHKLLALPTDKLVLFTSPGKIIEDGRKALTDCIRYLNDLSIKVKNLSTSGVSVEDTVKDLFGGENFFRQLTNDQFSTANLIKSLLETT